MNTDRPCPIASQVADAVIERSRRGMAKYGVNAARTDLSREQWLQHFQEELLDAAVYAERLKSEVSEIESLKRQNAAMRAALEGVLNSAVHPDKAIRSVMVPLEPIRAALGSDAGHDFIPDDPQSDGTDAAHPAWWLGHEAGCLGLARRLQEAVDGRDDSNGVIGHERIEKLRRDILAMRRDFIPREQVKPLVDYLKAWKPTCDASWYSKAAALKLLTDLGF